MTTTEANQPPLLRRMFGEDQAARLLRIVALALLALIASTWKLWTPQQVFPQIPLFQWAVGLPPLADWIALAAVGCGAVGMLAWPHARWRYAWGGLLCGGLVLAVVLDQHRLQPWAYQFGLMTLALTLAAGGKGVRLCRLLVARIYIYSAWSQLDASFLATGGLGEQFAATFLQAIGLSSDSPAILSAGSWLLVIGELSVGVLLLIRCWRSGESSNTRFAFVLDWAGVGLAIALHVALLLILGPLGMNHTLGVLMWNIAFLVLLVPLFAPIKSETTGNRWTGNAIATAVIGVALILPLTEPLGWCDNWLAWSLYSSRNEKGIVTVGDPFVGTFVDEEPIDLGTLDRYRQGDRVRIDLWSLETLGVPIYPENRFRVGVALWIIERHGLKKQIALELAGPADRLSDRREVSRFEGAAEIEQAADRYWFNSHPRTIPYRRVGLRARMDRKGAIP